jgi:hypothetical protein
MFTYSTSVKSLEYISSLTLTSDQNTNIRKLKNLINYNQIWKKLYRFFAFNKRGPFC